MKRILLFLIFWGCVSSSKAQTISYTLVSGTITDLSSTPYANGSVLIQFVDVPGQQSMLGQNPGSTSFVRTYTVPLDVTGTFSVYIPANTSFSPSGTQWKFTVSSQGGYGIASATIPISGASQSISTSLSGLARIAWPSNGVVPPGSPGQQIASIGSGLNAWTAINPTIFSGAGGGSYTAFGFPAIQVLDCTGCKAASDIAPLCLIDSLAPSTAPFACFVMKTNGQMELVMGNTSCAGVCTDLETSASGIGELTLADGPSSTGTAQIDTRGGNIVIAPGAGPGGLGTGVVSMKNLQLGPIVSQGAGATVTGTGACASISITIASGFHGASACTGTTGASTVVITPPASVTPSIGTAVLCGGSDTTHTLPGSQSSFDPSFCTVSFTSVTTNDIVTFDWSGL